MKFVFVVEILCIIAVAIDSFQHCETKKDCHGTEICVNNLCVGDFGLKKREQHHVQCESSDNCLPGFCCVEGFCMPFSCNKKEKHQDPFCLTSDDCKPGYRCIRFICMPFKKA